MKLHFRNTRAWSLLLVFATFGSGCGGSSGGSDESSAPESGLHKDNSISVSGVRRTYDYYVPSGMGSEAVPLVILLHGHGGNADRMTGADGSTTPFKVWMSIAEAEKLILIFPEGVVGPDGATGWNDCRADANTNPSTDDVSFVAALIQRFRSSFNISSDRIYASGISNGGFMSLRLALELSDQIAAVGVIVAGMPANTECGGAVQPTSILFMNGTGDPLMPYAGGTVGNPADGRGSVLSTPDSVQYWNTLNQTTLVAPAISFPDLDTSDGSTVTLLRRYAGLQQTEVVLYEVDGGGHNGPSLLERESAQTELSVRRQNHDIEMANEVWEFFRDKRL